MKTLNNQLFEAFYKKYDSLLDEDFGQNYPKWLSDEFSKRIRRYNDHGRFIYRPNSAAPSTQPQINSRKITTTFNPITWPRADSIVNTLLSWGIDLHKTTFIEAPIPKNKKDVHILWPNIGFFHLDNSQVYAPGINDDEIFGLDDMGRAFKHVPFHDIISHTLDFGYINVINQSLSGEYAYKNKATSRIGDAQTGEHSEESLRSVKFTGYPVSITDPNMQTKLHPYGFQFDKSGYVKLTKAQIKTRLLRKFPEIRNLLPEQVDELARLFCIPALASRYVNAFTRLVDCGTVSRQAFNDLIHEMQAQENSILDADKKYTLADLLK